MNGDAPSLGYESYDLITRYRIAALGKLDHEVVSSSYDDPRIVFILLEGSALFSFLSLDFLQYLLIRLRKFLLGIFLIVLDEEIGELTDY